MVVVSKGIINSNSNIPSQEIKSSLNPSILNSADDHQLGYVS